MIEVRGLTKAFAPARNWWGRAAPAVLAVNGLDWTAPEACITGLLGPNGAGKTTTLRIVAGLVAPDAGQVRVAGIDVQREPLQARRRLGVLTDARGLYPRLTARENIVYHGRLQGLSAAQAHARVDQLGALLEMVPLLERPTAGFSQGERMKCALARALVHSPSHLLLDEPTNGLDVPATRGLRQVLRRLRDDEGRCIVVSSHIMQEVERLCDRVVVMAAGRTTAEGTLPELMARTGASDVEACYLALAHGMVPEPERLPSGAGAPGTGTGAGP